MVNAYGPKTCNIWSQIPMGCPDCKELVFCFRKGSCWLDLATQEINVKNEISSDNIVNLEQWKWTLIIYKSYLEFRSSNSNIINSYSASRDNWCTVVGDGGCRVSEVRAGTTSPMPDHKGFKLQ